MLDHDFEGADGKVLPLRIYDVVNKEGLVSVGVSANTAGVRCEFHLQLVIHIRKGMVP